VKFDPHSGLFLPERRGILKARPCMAMQQALFMRGGGSAPPPAFDPDYGWDAAKGNETSITESGQLVEWTGLAASTSQISRTITQAVAADGNKVYCEFELVAKSNSAIVAGFGVATTSAAAAFFNSKFWSRWSRRPNTSTSACGFNSTGGLFNSGTQTANAVHDFSPGDRLQVALHRISGSSINVWFGVNNTWAPNDPSGSAAMTANETPLYFAASSFTCGTPGSDSISWRIYPHAAGQLYAPPTGYTPYQP
jgi:hypothetical protein